MTADAVRLKVTKLGIDPTKIEQSYWHLDEQYTDYFKQVFREVWPNLQQGDLPDTSAGMHDVPIRIECRLTDKYDRAIAKIALHYLLVKTECGVFWA